MEILKFTLKGRSACFKKPDVNSYYYFTYGNIHKVAVLGVLGAVLGYGGYSRMRGFQSEKKQKALEESFPEFYERLKNLQISILPVYDKGIIPKKIQVFNNSVGYASKEQGGNLIVKEQWLENPKWEICILIQDEESRKVKEAVVNHRCVYYPYLGKNDHPADIVDVTVEEGDPVAFEMGKLSCLVPVDEIEIAELDYDELEEMDAFDSFKYVEALPYGLNPWTNLYTMRKFQYSDVLVKVKKLPVFQLANQKKILFY